MIKFFIKYGGLILEILVVAALVFFVFWINPGNIFGNGLRLKNTANNIAEIKQIGQLVTAEYYGEVIASYDESVLQLVEEEEVGQRADDLFREMKAYVLSKHLNSISEKIKTSENQIDLPKEEKKERRSFFARLFNWGSTSKKDFKQDLKNDFDGESNEKSPTKSNNNSDEVPELFLNDKLTPEILAFFYNRKSVPEAGKNGYKNLFWKLFQEVKQKNIQLNDVAFDEYMQQGLASKGDETFSDFHYGRLRKDSGKSEDLNKVRLAMIGRGWVKAGVDFGEFNEQNFIYDKELGVVHIYGVYPKILDKDINPWFIPEKKVPGFQILQSRKANFEHAKKVKLRCIAKLEKMAREAGIVEQAELQSKETIKNFIGLLSETEVKEVYFHNDTLSVMINEIVADKLVTFEEAAVLDSLIQKEIKTIGDIKTEGLSRAENKRMKIRSQERLMGMLAKLNKIQYNEFATCFNMEEDSTRKLMNTNYSRFSFITDQIIVDSVLTKEEYTKLKALKLEGIRYPLNVKSKYKALELETWYPNDPLEFITDYNNMICAIGIGIKTYGETVKDTLIKRKDSSRHIEEWEKNGFNPILLDEFEEEIVFRLIKNLPENEQLDISKLKYQVNLPKNWRGKFSKNGQGGKFFDDKFHNGSLIVKTKSFFSKFNRYQSDENTIECDSLTLERGEESWKIIETSCKELENNEEQRLILENMVNQVLEDSGPGWFARTSQKVKDAIGIDL